MDARSWVFQNLQRLAMERPAATAIIGSGSERVTYHSLWLLVTRRSAELLARPQIASPAFLVEDRRDIGTIIDVLAAGLAGVPFIGLSPRDPEARWAAARALTGAQQTPGLMDPRLSGLERGRCAYITFTSGTTGRPKAIAVSWEIVARLVQWQKYESRLLPAMRTAQSNSLSFDVSVQEIFGSLVTGGTLVLIDSDALIDPTVYARRLATAQVERVHLPYVRLLMLAMYLSSRDLRSISLNEVISTGEALECTDAIRSSFERWSGTTLRNHYGPAETHLATSFSLRGGPASWPQLSPIGRPINGVKLFINDEPCAYVGDAQPGEVAIGGNCTLLGYLGERDDVESRFVKDSRSQCGRLYRTGDLAMLRAGQLEYAGRIDLEVKIRGVRVDLTEVAKLATDVCGVVWSAAVVSGTGVLDRYLRLFVNVDEQFTEQVEGELQRVFNSALPAQVLPAQIVVLDRIPLTQAGKTDRRYLETYSRSGSGA